MIKNHLAIGAAILALPVLSSGQSVTVSKTATADYTSIAAAIAAVETNAAVPNIVRVIDSAKYEESLTISQPLVLEATEEERATILVNFNPIGTLENGGIVINLPSTMTTGTVELRNFEILPSVSTAGLRMRTAIESKNNNLFLWVDNCLITANDGSNEPIVTSGTESRIFDLIPTQPTYKPEIVQWGDDGIVLGRTTDGAFEGAGVELLFEDSIISHFRDDYNDHPIDPVPYAIVMQSSYTYDMPAPLPTEFRLTRIEGESAISFARIGLHVTGDIITKSDGERIRMRGFADTAIHLAGGANTRSINDVIIDGGSNNGIWDEGVGTTRMTMTNSIMFYFGRHTIMVRKPVNHSAEGLMTIEDSTLVGGRTINTGHSYRLEPGTLLDVVIKDSIIGGQNGFPSAGLNVFSLAGDNTVTLMGTAILQEGPFSLRNTSNNPFSLSATSTVVGTATTGADPMFMAADGTGDPHHWTFLPPSPDFMNVQNTAYATADSEGGPLGGGAEYVGSDSNVDCWHLY